MFKKVFRKGETPTEVCKDNSEERSTTLNHCETEHYEESSDNSSDENMVQEKEFNSQPPAQETLFRWSVAPSSEQKTMLKPTVEEEDGNDSNYDHCYTVSDDEDMFIEEETPAPQIAGDPKSKKKKKKKSALTRSSGSKKSKSKKDMAMGGKKKKKQNNSKKKKAVKKVSELIEVSKKKTSSLQGRMRASLAVISTMGNKSHTVVPKIALEKETMAALQEGLEEDDEPEAQQEADATESTSMSPAPTQNAVALQKTSVAGLLKKSPSTANMTPLQRFKFAGKKMQQIQQIRDCAMDSQFAAAFNSNLEDSANMGLMSSSDKATVDKLLADLQQYEATLEKERNQLSEERDMMQLQQEAVEHLLEEETKKTQQLQARILELEHILDTQVHKRENEELMMKVQMLEAENERQEASLAKLVSEKQENLKRQSSGHMPSAHFSSVDLWTSHGDPANANNNGDSSKDDDQEFFESRSSIMSKPGGARTQGELLQLQSSLKEKNKTVEEQAKELARLKDRLDTSEEVQKMQRLEATCDDFRKESKQFRAEVEHLKQELAKNEASRQAESQIMEKMRQGDLEKNEALKKAEDGKNEALRQLELHNLLNFSSQAPSQSELKGVLDIDGNNVSKSKGWLGNKSYANICNESQEAKTTSEETGANSTAVSNKSEQQEQSGWFGLGGGDTGLDNEEKLESYAEEEGFNWFGFGGKKEETIKDGQAEYDDSVTDLPSIQVTSGNERLLAKVTSLSNLLDSIWRRHEMN